MKPTTSSHVLAQITNRLLLSRDRSKRQYLIERIGHIWSPALTRRCCIIRSTDIQHSQHTHADPTPESIAAVTSFERDEKVNVRMAVAFALRQKTVSDEDAVPTLSQMLADAHPLVRINAAYALSFASRQGLDREVIDAALNDKTWTVRWAVAKSLASTEFADQAWAALRSSCPPHESSLPFWLDFCHPYADRFASDEQLVSKVRSRLQSMPDTSYTRSSGNAEFQRLLKPIRRQRNDQLDW